MPAARRAASSAAAATEAARGEADEHDLALEGVVVGAPALVVHALRGAQRHGIAATEDGSGSDSLHLRHPPLVRSFLAAWLAIILGGSVVIPVVRTAERLVCRGDVPRCRAISSTREVPLRTARRDAGQQDEADEDPADPVDGAVERVGRYREWWPGSRSGCRRPS